MESNVYDVAIIGAGASGLMTAVGLRENNKNCKVIIIDKNEKIGKKMYISGKGRCNVTNDCDIETIIANTVHNGKFLYKSLNCFGPKNVIDFFEKSNCKLIVERGNRVFPKSGKSSDIINVFKKYLQLNNIDLLLNCELKSITLSNKSFNLNSSQGCIVANNVVIATGGKSYPLTGSTGDGYKFAKTFGLNLVNLKPALCGFVVNNIDELIGLTLKKVSMKVFVNNKSLFNEFGDVTFYKNLLAGPLSLKASSLLNNYSDFTISIDVKPKVDYNELKSRYYKLCNSMNNNTILQLLMEFLPAKLGKYLCKIVDIETTTKIKDINKEKVLLLFKYLKNIEFSADSLDKIENGIVTSGGVDVKEIDPTTMQSKKVNNLYFVGEVLDLDAFTGGFNMQIAFATGYNCGYNLAQKLNKEGSNCV